MAQNFVGSNNINLLVPSGQFGTRLQGGKDSASERYIFTYLQDITRKIFPASDDNILKYLNDDGQSVEPIYYAPIIPMILVNGGKGIGTGFSTDILPYNPLDIIDILEKILTNRHDISEPSTLDNLDFMPYYEGFQGTIKRLSDSKYLIKGKYETIGVDKIHVTELPIGFWTDDFKSHLESLLETTDSNGKKITPSIKDYDDMSKDTNVDFIIQFHKGKLAQLEATSSDNDCNGVEKLLKLSSTCSTNNMHLFDHNDVLKKYTRIDDIIYDYFGKRLELYQTRKDYIVQELTQEAAILSNKYRYIQEVLNDTIDLRKKSKEQIDSMLDKKKYDRSKSDNDFKYLVKMPMDSVSSENAKKLNDDFENKKKELEIIQSTTIQTMWLNELKDLRNAYEKYQSQRVRLMLNDESDESSKKVKKKKTTQVKK